VVACFPLSAWHVDDSIVFFFHVIRLVDAPPFRLSCKEEVDKEEGILPTTKHKLQVYMDGTGTYTCTSIAHTIP
jgi:hypothetical protein